MAHSINPLTRYTPFKQKYWAQNRAPPHQIVPFLGHLPGEEAYGPLEASWPRNDPKSMTAA